MGLFKRNKDADSGGKAAPTRLYYASDIHGSAVLWRKFLNAAAAYKAEVLVMGGDVTGKVVVPFVEREDGFHVDLFGQRSVVSGEALEEMEHKVRNNGMYPHRMSGEELERVAALSEEEREGWFADVMRATFDGWLALADERLDPATRCFVMPGNDDPAGVDRAIEEAGKVEACDGRVVRFGDYTMISLGYANRTPFDSPRELTEEELLARIVTMAEEAGDMSRCIFNLHVPPYESSLDTAPALDENLAVVMSGSAPKMIGVGSTAVREAIERFQPLLSLHGHVHESPGAEHIGRTLSINPGSDYHTGRISGCLIQLRGDTVRHQFVTG
jgi:Icc-related predicted phosphoesterase